MKCTAPVRGHHTDSGRANCPVHGRDGYSNYSRYYSYDQPYVGSLNSLTNLGRDSNESKKKAPWSSANSTVLYTSNQIRTLTPIRKVIEERANIPDLKDVFLCHSWDDRKGVAKELNDLLESKGVKVWFSEKDILLGSMLVREIDKGLTKSRGGIVLVTPSFIKRIEGEGIAEKELSALLATDRLIPIVHETTFEKLRDVSPLLASRSGLSTDEESMDEIADKIAELISE